MGNRVSLTGLATLAAIAIAPITPVSAGTYTLLHSFTGYPSDGRQPVASLINVKGTLYGTTTGGGTYAAGTVFAVNPTTGAVTTIYSFARGNDGLAPSGSLISIRGMLYGTTVAGGGAGNSGTVFAVNPATGAETVLYAFKGGSDGKNPQSGLIDIGGTLYGTTTGGGTGHCEIGCGTIFALDLKTGGEIVLHSFKDRRDGGFPSFSLANVDGRILGTTSYGGINGKGVVFSINPKTGIEKLVYSFLGGSDGIMPIAGPINVHGTLYGTTYTGGSYNSGTVYSVDAKTGAEAVVFSFGGPSNTGILPTDNLVDVDGTFFGSASTGGIYDGGTLISLNPKTGEHTLLYSFGLSPYDGMYPQGGMVSVGGTLFGTTMNGGVNSYGTVFSYAP